MGKKKPWCERATDAQQFPFVTDKHTWAHTPRMFFGGLLQLLVLAGTMGLHVAIGVLYFNWLREEHEPNEPSFWGSALPVWGIGVTGLVVLFCLSLGFTLPGKRRMKSLLIPIRCQRCPKCFYDLSGRPHDEDICPECGVIAPRRECVRLWCKLLRSRF